MSDDLRRLEDKIDKIDSNISRIDVTLSSQHEVLKEHIRRSNLLEEQMKPLQAHVSGLNGIIKFIGIISAALIGIEVIYRLIKGG
jgi:hypothetical protein